jgi:N-acetylneuraminic acid mutarotase
MKLLPYILMFLFLPTFVVGQYIEGRVTDSSSGKPIKDVHVYIDNVEEGTQTLSNGKYQLKFSEVLPQTAKIRFSHVSYIPIQLDFDKSKSIYNIALTPKVNALNEVQVVQNSQLKPFLRFKKMKSMGSRLHAFGSTLVDDKIYVIGGNASFLHDGTKETLNRLENSELSQLSLDQFLKYSYSYFNANFFKGDLHVYNIATDSWERQKDVFKKRAHHNIYYYKNKLYVIGGINLSINKRKEYLDNTIEIFDLETKEMLVDQTNPHQAVNFSSFLVGDELIVLGGSTKQNRNGTKNYSEEVHLYKLSEGLWYKVDSMPNAKETSGIRVNDKIYLIGGFNRKPLSAIEQFDITTRTWEAVGNLFFGMSNPALAYHNNTIYIYNNGKFCTFNTKSKELNEYFIEIDLQNSEMHIADNSIFLVGGLRTTEREIAPSSSIYRIALSDFDSTRVRRSKSLK